MKTFREFEYVRPNMTEVKARCKKITEALEKAADYSAARAALLEMDSLVSSFNTMASLANIRNTLDTSDKFYEEERAFFDSALPEFADDQLRFNRVLLASPFKAEITAEFGEEILRIKENEVKRFIPEIIPDMQEDNRIASEYEKLLASCKVDFRGEECNIYGLLKYMENPDRAIRKEAYQKWAGFFESHEEELDDIYDRLVKIRDRMAKKMGFENFIPLAYLNMGRRDYGREEVARFREQVHEVMVPVCSEIFSRQAQRIGVKQLHYYDEKCLFTEGNAVPDGDRAFMVAQAQRMYDAMDPKVGEFFRTMVERELLELDTKPNKAVGGYCDFLPDFKAPFIFSNFNGTSADVDVLTHEAGHAFMSYCSDKTNALSDYLFSTSDVNEIHSMSMEFFAHPYMELFFGEKADKYRFAHMCDSFTFVPYGVCVDEFQHRVYENPEMTPAERKAVWKELEKKYLPHRSYDGNEFMEKGSVWQRQLHIYMCPFYYIDYTLAAMSAFEFYGRMQENPGAAWEDYYRLCCAGGSKSYLELLSLANLSNPFTQGSVKKAVCTLIQKIRATDDTAL